MKRFFLIVVLIGVVIFSIPMLADVYRYNPSIKVLALMYIIAMLIIIDKRKFKSDFFSKYDIKARHNILKKYF